MKLLSLGKIVSALMCVSGAASAADSLTWTVIDGSFQSQVVTLTTFTKDEIRFVHGDGSVGSMPFKDFLRCSRESLPVDPIAIDTPEPHSGQTVVLNGVPMAIINTSATVVTLQAADGRQMPLLTSAVRQLLAANAARVRRGPLAIILSNEDLLVGEPLLLDGPSLSWKSTEFPDIKIPLDQIRRLVRLPEKQPPTSTPTEDIASLVNGDSVHGIVSALSGESLTLQPTSGDATTIPLNSVRLLQFADTAAPPPRAAHAFVVHCPDGSHLTLAGVALADNAWTLTRLDGGTMVVPLTTIQQVEQVGGPVVWLSDLTPTENVQQSFLGRSWPAKFDQAVDGNALAWKSRHFEHGIGVHAYSKLVFDLPPDFDQLHFAYCLQGDSPLADVNVRVELDGKVVHEASHVRAGSMSTPSSIDILAAKQISLEVEFGNDQDVLDRFEWIEPALLRAEKK